ncbi:MAG: hypothetical protein H6611_09760 [Ignavibacteriales bacterium]|nr:hypothetical protein [Ignavibacteriales bacterium]
MIKSLKLTFQLIIVIFLFSILLNAQELDGNWSVDYVTSDSPDSLNSVGFNVISVTSLAENSFVALVNRENTNSHYLVGYRNAGKNSGRLGYYPYAQNNLQTKWINLFDQEFVENAKDLASRGNLIYVANNQGVNHSILAFEVKEDSIYSYPQRYKTNSPIWAIDIDGNGRIYVTKVGDDTTPGSVMILESPDEVPIWVSNGNKGTVLQDFMLPDIGSPRGITVNENGTVLYVSNWNQNKVYCYVGDPENGYLLSTQFNLSVNNQFESTEGQLYVGPHGLQLMRDKNLLFITHDTENIGAANYEYGRIYIVNPNTGAVLDTIDCAEWNFAMEGMYNNHNSQNNASGYTSNYAVDFDENYNIYTQSYAGWTVDKWQYSTDLPNVQLILDNKLFCNINIFLEGAYNDLNENMTTNISTIIPLSSPFEDDQQKVNSIPPNTIDWVLIELRDKDNSSLVVAKRTGFLLANGTIVDLDGISPCSFSVQADDYYIVIKHRNHLSVMSANPVSLTIPTN